MDLGAERSEPSRVGGGTKPEHVCLVPRRARLCDVPRDARPRRGRGREPASDEFCLEVLHRVVEEPAPVLGVSSSGGQEPRELPVKQRLTAAGTAYSLPPPTAGRYSPCRPDPAPGLKENEREGAGPV